MYRYVWIGLWNGRNGTSQRKPINNGTTDGVCSFPNQGKQEGKEGSVVAVVAVCNATQFTWVVVVGADGNSVSKIAVISSKDHGGWTNLLLLIHSVVV